LVTPVDDEEGRTTFLPPGWADEPPPSVEPVGHYLVAIGGAATGERVEVGDAPVTIGRSAEQTLVFAGDPEVSRVHARVSLIDGAVTVEDLGSTNGTFVEATRLTKPVTLQEGNVLRVGHQLLKYERRNKRDVARSQELDRDLRRAANYVLALLPPPVDAQGVCVEWCFVPSTQLGGDGFGYFWLDQDTFVFYLIDVSGHGVGAAMHSVTVLNVLRQRAIPDVDFKNPAKVLSSLNSRFQMDDHHGLYFTMWYGVYRPSERRLLYGTAGHHPAYLLRSDNSEAVPLGAPALMIGAMPDATYELQTATVPAGSALHLFSDGVFEIVTTDQQQWALNDFLPLLTTPFQGSARARVERLHDAVRRAARPGPFDDDFSLMVVTFA
jgi:serine phosphatase RsbU (regulator of sigma subunit)